MNKLFSLLCFLITTQVIGQGYVEKTVRVGNIGLQVTNAGTVGRPNVRNEPQGLPSMRFPINSGVEHLFEAGIWIGALVDGQVRVSTGAIDDASGYATGKAGFEYTPIPGATVIERSTLTSSPNFSLSAVSHQDFVMNFTDSFTTVPGTTQPINNHLLPLNAVVRLETYAWNFSFADHFVILNYQITNRSDRRWDSVYIGNWSDLVVRNVLVTTDRGSAFFSRGSVGYVDSLQGIYAYDINGDVGYTNSYGCIQFLGSEWRGRYFHPNNAATFISEGLPIPKVMPQFWFYNQQAPTNDELRYARMKTSANFSDPNLRSPGNRVQLLSVGPFVSIEPGETVSFALAYLAARQIEDNSVPGTKDTPLARQKLLENLGWSKRTFIGEDINENGILDPGEDLNGNGKLDRFILPEPPATPKVKIITEDQKVTLYWDDLAESSIDPISRKEDFEGYRIYRTNLGADLRQDFELPSARNLLAQWDKKGNAIGFNNGFDAVKLKNPIKFDGDTIEYKYKFEVNNLSNGWQYLFVVTSFDEGDANLGLPSLESSFIANSFRTMPGIEASSDSKVGVYPNPFSINAAWDGSRAREKRIMFTNLPAKAEITVYTLAGDLVASMFHDSSKNFNNSSAEWFKSFGGNGIQMAGGEHAWDILSDNKQALATGLYLFSVKDLSNNAIQTGKFAIIK